ncbi:Transducin/WD40 repeat-like superfamily protein [Perilla frutescens var. frutescens]|nr:Transducin/WD40 repeat-like superfamily protein [Perilla frutescens var. frutescens]
MEPEVLIASSPTDADISCWDLRTGAEHLRYKSCAFPPHGPASVADRFLASSQPQIEVRSFPAEAIRPIACNSQGTNIVRRGISGDIYFWEVATGKLLKKWHAHYTAVTYLACLAFNDDQYPLGKLL